MVARVGRHRNLPINRGSKPAFDFDTFIFKRDYVGALAVLEFEQGASNEVERLLWIAYCSYRLGDYERSKEVYLELISGSHDDVPKDTGLYLACVYFRMGMFNDCERAALQINGGDSELKNRILLHVARVNDDETKVAKYRQLLQDSKEDRLSAAAIEFSFRHRYQETADVYKRILVDDKDDLALNVYVAMCYFKMVREFC